MQLVGYGFISNIGVFLCEKYGFGDFEDPNLLPPINPCCLAIVVKSGASMCPSANPILCLPLHRGSHAEVECVCLHSNLLPRNVSNLGFSY